MAERTGVGPRGGWPGGTPGERQAGQRPGSRAVTRVALAAKGGIHWPQRERRARAGPALHWPPLITFSGPLPAGTDNAGRAFEVRKGCRGGSLSHLLPSPSSQGRGPSRTKLGAGRSRPETRETKGKQTGLEPGARCRVCPPPCRARMMDGCSQPARLPGRPRYLHNTGVPPVTSDTALPGAEARWPRGSWSHPGNETACEDPARPGEPWAWGRAAQQPALGSGPEASSLPASHGGGAHWGPAASTERGLSCPRGAPRA